MNRQRSALHAQQRTFALGGEADDEDELDGAGDDFLDEDEGLGIPGMSRSASLLLCKAGRHCDSVPPGCKCLAG